VARKADGKKGASASAPATPEAPLEIPADAYVVELPTFQGPLDLLLHLIQKHELDILDIPVSFITEKYLAYLDVMRSLTIDLASEYLVMAATLLHIKSKMLLPQVPADQEDPEAHEEEDPRAELVRRLLEYQKYKAAGESLNERDTLGNTVFPRGTEDVAPPGPAPFQPFGVFNLLDALEKVLARTKTKIEHAVVFDRISITDRIVELTERLKVRRKAPFDELFDGDRTTFEVIITFLAMLEMCKLKLMRIYQAESPSSVAMSPIHVELLVLEEDDERGVLDFASADAAEGRAPPPAANPDEEPEPAGQEPETGAGSPEPETGAGSPEPETGAGSPEPETGDRSPEPVHESVGSPAANAEAEDL
jgi:segregation and condensation protein A